MYVHILYVEDVTARIEMRTKVIHIYWHELNIYSYICLTLCCMIFYFPIDIMAFMEN